LPVAKSMPLKPPELPPMFKPLIWLALEPIYRADKGWLAIIKTAKFGMSWMLLI
jgi:hypothetical protein